MKSRFLPWAQGLLGQFVEGACDSFLAVTGGNTAAQLTSTEASAFTLKQLGLSMLLLGAIYAASYLKKTPTPWAQAAVAPAVESPSSTL